MSRANAQLRELAQRLIAAEARVVNRADDKLAPPAFRVCERLRPQLANLMGDGGFHALLARSLSLAKGQADWLHAVALTGDHLGVSEMVGEKAGPEAMAAGGVALVAQLLALLVAFIGEGLTLRMVREVWPNLPLDDLDLGESP